MVVKNFTFLNFSNKYLKEIAARITLTIILALSLFCCGYIKKELLMFYLLNLTSSQHKTKELDHFIFTDVTEIFYTYLTIILFFNTKATTLFSVYHIVNFFFSGLKLTEKTFFRFTYLSINFILILSFFFTNKILFPQSWLFFIEYSQSTLVKNSTLFFESKVKSCVELYTQAFYFTSCNLVLFFILFKNIFQKKVKKRKYSFFFLLFFSLFVVPIDFTIQVFLFVTVLFFYEITFFLFLFKNWIFTLYATKKF